MRHAVIEEAQSTCARNHVGCVIARDRRIIATGYNGAPAGMSHCIHPPDEEVEYSWGFRSGCKVAVHAEANALAFAARHGLATEGATLYTTLSPCYECAKLIINSGIVEVYYLREYRTPEGVALLALANVEVRQLTWS